MPRCEFRTHLPQGRGIAEIDALKHQSLVPDARRPALQRDDCPPRLQQMPGYCLADSGTRAGHHCDAIHTFLPRDRAGNYTVVSTRRPPALRSGTKTFGNMELDAGEHQEGQPNGQES
jgi:hypothetical protein